MLFAAAALAILIPPNAFPGAQVLDWIGLGGALVLLGYEFARRRADPGGAAARRQREAA